MSEHQSDLGELFSELRHERQERASEWRDKAPAMLKDRGVPFESKNDGAHLIVTYNNLIADYWPGTGRFKIRNGREGAGIRYLLHLLKVPDAPPR